MRLSSTTATSRCRCTPRRASPKSGSCVLPTMSSPSTATPHPTALATRPSAPPDQPEECYPLVLERCDRCGNVQLRDCVDAHALYSQYLYMTPESPSLTRHYAALEQHLADRGVVRPEAAVLEIGSNTGMFLRHLQPHVRQVIGVDPAANICRIANASGIETVCDFFDARSAATLEGRFGHPDLIVARHCFAHNRDPHELLRGVTT